MTTTAEIKPLTIRERQVILRLSHGTLQQEVAGDLGISAHTVKEHVKHILDKLMALNTTHAVAIALRSGEIL